MKFYDREKEIAELRRPLSISEQIELLKSRD